MSEKVDETAACGDDGASLPPNGDPSLELLSEYPTPADGAKPPLLFVHGAFVGAWCWAEHFLPYFAARGYPAHALSLRGHGGSDGATALDGAGIDDYVTDLRRTVERFEEPPVLVGHSMGGVVVQRFVGNRTAPGAVLMASVPPQGMAGASLQLAFSDPLTWWQLGLFQGVGSRATSTRAVRRALFSADLPTERLERYTALSQRESTRALAELAAPTVSGAGRLEELPTLVVGAGDDSLVPRWAVESTARAHATDARFVPDVAHAMMLDTGWQRAASVVAAWLEEHDVGQ